MIEIITSKKNIALRLFLILVLVLYFLNINNNYALAQTTWSNRDISAGATTAGVNGIVTYDPAMQKVLWKNTAQDWAIWLADKANRWDEILLQTLKSKAFSGAVETALKKIAYDTATWLGSGGKGQKPMFITEGWGEYLGNTADEAAGQFVESLGKAGAFGTKFNLCEPDLNLKITIGLGLVSQTRPSKPACTFSQMRKNWEQSLEDPQFLNKFQDMFKPQSNDLSIAYNLHMGMIQTAQNKSDLAEKERISTQGWINLKTLDERQKSPPLFPQTVWDKSYGLVYSAFGKDYGDALVNASNVFLNQYLITLLNTKLSEIGKNRPTYTSPYSGDYGGLTNPNASSAAGGIKEAKEKLIKIIQPNFTVRGDYSILAELSMCSKADKAGPTNCVITSKFSQAIQDKKTIGEAMKDGNLDPGGIFGFSSSGLEPSYQEGYPYRSMLILRKFRILPVGWELAAQYIRSHPEEVGTKNLQDLVNCFSADDEFIGYSAPWCVGLVDPGWVLKAPLNYCKREGPGPEITSQEVVGIGSDSKLTISRNSSYCGDEQSCIKEKSDGSCQQYGYCTEEKRKWNFGSDTCEPVYNTCQTFKSGDGNTVSYLQNTLDYSGCNMNNAGCLAYCNDFDYTNQRFSCTNTTGSKTYLNGSTESCDESAEGCSEFIRNKSGAGVNLLFNGSFENNSVGVSATAAGATVPLEEWSIRNNAQGTFEDSTTPTSQIHSGNVTLHVNAQGNSGLLAYFNQHVMPDGFAVADNEIYSISAYIYVVSGSVRIDIGTVGNFSSATSSIASNNRWQRITATIVKSPAINIDQFGIYADNGPAEFYIDDIKLERGSAPTGYTNYRQLGVFQEKLLPSYLGSTCYRIPTGPTPDYRLVASYPAVCDDYARRCNRDEEGCELYTSVDDGLSIPAKTTIQDNCPKECVGYDEFLQTETYFDSPRQAQFIPKLSRSCNSEQAGCDEFTNLDKLNQGGEAREYFTYLRQCIKPSATANCSDFYSWEGSGEAGYQLKVHSLEVDMMDPELGPQLTSPDGLECNFAIYNLPADDPSYNPDCTQFYNRGGLISYHLYTRTISCSENCFPYRRTEKNVDSNITNAAICSTGGATCDNAAAEGLESCWNNADSECVVCKNGGRWNVQHQACIYMAIPSEGRRCAAAQAGCREYTGKTGNNMRIVLNSIFEGSTENWTGSYSVGANPSNQSLRLGGHSLYVDLPAYSINISLGKLITEGKSYYLEFWSQANSGNFNVSLSNGAGDSSSFSSSTEPSIFRWEIYKFNLDNLNHEVTDNETLTISSNAEFYIDNIKLVEITDRYYKIKSSLTVPDICNYNVLGLFVGATGVNSNLGCSAYTDRDNKVHYLHSFTSLCQDSAVGCEQLINTRNSDDYRPAYWNDSGAPGCDASDGSDCKEVDYDEFIYAVFDREKFCNAIDKGCERLGEPVGYQNDTAYSSVWLKNNPNSYNNILCSESGVNCQGWEMDSGEVYFKDPGLNTCEWRKREGDNTGRLHWYQRKVKRCDDGGVGAPAARNGTIDYNGSTLLETDFCLSDADCDSTGVVCSDIMPCASGSCVNGLCHDSCIIDNHDTECTTNPIGRPYKTIGIGGLGTEIQQPTGNWAGLCPSGQSGCTEYIEPTSSFNNNMIFNGDFSQNIVVAAAPPDAADGWTQLTAGGTQEIALEPHKFYVLSIEGYNTAELTNISAGITNPFNLFNDSTNQFTTVGNTVNLSASNNTRNSTRFYVVANSAVNVRVRVSNVNAYNNTKVELKEVFVNYQLKQDIDLESCDGRVDFSDGCVLFNQRAVSGGGTGGVSYTGSQYDVDINYRDWAGWPTASSSNDTNVLLKVQPDRECSKWLACRSYSKDEKGNNQCYGIGLCNSLDQNGICNNFLVEDRVNQEVTLPGSISEYSNASGYVKVGYQNNALENSMRGMYPLGSMQQEGNVVQLSNGNFEIYGSNQYPIGWKPVNSNTIWDSSMFKVINNPVEAQTEGVGYAPEGQSFIKVAQISNVESEILDISPSTEYVLSAQVNTLHLNGGEARVRVQPYTDAEVAVSVNPVTYSLSLPANSNWQTKTLRFNVGTPKIKIILESTSTPGSVVAGNFYVDDVKVMPVLGLRETGSVADQYAHQSCRLYPKENSLSCDYYEDSGNRLKGWPGYCLEYDRTPGNPDACLMWWPIDKPNGSGVDTSEMFSGYSGKYPLYYCDNINGEFAFVESRASRMVYSRRECSSTWLGNLVDGFFAVTTGGLYLIWRNVPEDSQSGSIDICPNSPNGGYHIDMVRCGSSGNWRRRCRTYCYYCNPHGYDGNDTPNEYVTTDDAGIQWYTYNGNLINWTGGGWGGWDEGKLGVRVYDWNAGKFYNTADYLVGCNKVWQVVNSFGESKAWLGRVYAGSTYTTKLQPTPLSGPGFDLYNYSADSPPFGASSPPEPLSNPYEWDGDGRAGIQPLILTADTSNARSGMPYSCVNTPHNGANGQCANFGLCSVTRGVCLNVPNNSPVKEDPNPINNPIAFCPENDNTKPCYNNWEQNILTCPRGEVCDTTLLQLNNITTSPINNLRRIFAKSYGTWQWDNPQGHCSDNPSVICDQEHNQCPDGICENRCSLYGIDITAGEYRMATSTTPCTTDAQCANMGTGEEDPIIDTVSEWNTFSQCINVNNNNLATCAETGTLATNYCSGLVDPDLSDCLLDFRTTCERLINTRLSSPTPTQPAGLCRIDLQPCNTVADCRVVGRCAPTICSGGGNDTHECNAAQTCANAHCIFDTTAGRYTVDSTAPNNWRVPTELCAGGVRPALFSPADADYCAILPRISNIKVNDNNTSHVNLAGNALAKFTFNTDVEENQMPLVAYYVNWGDGETTDIAGASMTDRPNADTPHTLYHVYDYWGTRFRAAIGSMTGCCANAGGALTCTGAAGLTCGATNCCAVRPSVKIKDNWGWCNNGVTGDPCPALGYVNFDYWIRINER